MDKNENSYDKGLSSSIQLADENVKAVDISVPYKGVTTNVPDVGGPFVLTVIELNPLPHSSRNTNLLPLGNELAERTRFIDTVGIGSAAVTVGTNV